MNLFKNNQFKVIALFVGLFIVLVSILFLDSAWAEQPETTAQTITLYSDSTTLDDSLFLMPSILQTDTEQKVEFSDIKPNFNFNGFGFKWRLKDNTTQTDIKLYFKLDDNQWLEVNAMESASEQDINSEYIFSDPIFLMAQNIKVKATGNTNNLADLELIYFDSSQPSKSILNNITEKNRTISSSNKLKVISRQEWGANEDYRFWEPSYHQPKAFVIHHTAGGDGGDDPASTVRGIYYWHTAVLGWGDIGYNYLVDKQGNIYEGRYGGDMVIGAHTYNTYRDINYNEGTIGISILGCFEDEKSGCYNVSNYNKEIKDSVSTLIANKAIDLNISLDGKRILFDQSISSVVGHQNLDYTLCPGNIILDKLPKIRAQARATYSTLSEGQAYKAKLIEHNFVAAYFVGSTNNITISYKNTGDKTLPAKKTYLKITNVKTGEKEKIYLEEDLAVGATTDFNLDWQASRSGNQDIIMKLYRKKNYIMGSKKTIRLRVDNPNKGKVKKHNLPTAVLQKWDPQITIKYINTGETIWDKTQTGLFINSQKVASLQQKSVVPEQIGTFIFNLKSIKKLKKGKINLVIKLKQGSQTIQKSRWLWTMRMD